MTTTLAGIDLQELKETYDREGYAVARGLFTPAEVEEIKAEFEMLNRTQKDKSHFDDGIRDANDPLFHFPRVVHPHRFNSLARRYLVHPAVRTCLVALMGEEPVATQTMYYFKPPGARGQAMHQDNMYLLVEPGTCLGAWTAIDKVDRENGCMMVVPGSHRGNILCQEDGGEALRRESFTGHVTRIPKGMKAVEVPMEPGDTLFFNGGLIHGSGPNRSKDRFRRSFIGHYAAGSVEKISKFYIPLIKMDGTEYDVTAQTGGGACGQEWVGAVH
ncbi:MAG TPA: phytanoyl-CoA dioxygenase family protein [Candidatus Methylacidiphilales bacterium]|jgi:ectoine hydroxylase-related dioxygenase (phytanoyl-CoA dioxygenase family)|nr:phytanoyl-CoA dioxygenase family protein [Candidatus Methylacidiphilales bacterium]